MNLGLYGHTKINENLEMESYLIFFSFFLFKPIYVYAGDGGFVSIDSSYKIKADSEITIKNMPAVKSQDSIGVCFGFTDAALIDFTNCKAMNIDCGSLPPAKMASPLDLARYSINPDKEKSKARLGYVGLHEGGDAILALQNSMFEVGQVASEGCVQFDQIISKLGSSKEINELQSAAWQRLKNTYRDYKNAVAKCPECTSNFTATAVDKINQDFNLRTSPTETLAALASETYSEFLDKLLIPERCARGRYSVKFERPQQLKIFPGETKPSYEKLIQMVRTAVTNQSPVIVNDYCTDEMPPKNAGNCNQSHTFLLDGYRKVCNFENKCREMVKVHNSWGEAWQEKYNGGWVDAETMFSRIAESNHMLGWLEPIEI